jgi:hypothetical protein
MLCAISQKADCSWHRPDDWISMVLTGSLQLIASQPAVPVKLHRCRKFGGNSIRDSGGVARDTIGMSPAVDNKLDKVSCDT